MFAHHQPCGLGHLGIGLLDRADVIGILGRAKLDDPRVEARRQLTFADRYLAFGIEPHMDLGPGAT